MNEFGHKLTRVMDEQGIEGVEELLERMKPLMPADHPEVGLADLESIMTEERPALGSASSYDVRFFLILEDALCVPDETTIELMGALFTGWRRQRA
jgi:hypothetical protein